MKLKYGLMLFITMFLCGADLRAAEVTDCDDPLIDEPVEVEFPEGIKPV